MGKVYGYARVSSREQNEDRQLIALKNVQVLPENIFVDKQSGKDFDRPKYKALIDQLKENDLVYIKSIDRLGRNYSDIIEQWKIITKDKAADLVIIDMPILDTRTGKDLMGTFLSDIVLALLSYVSENERINIHQRQEEGIAAAKQRGVRFGSPVKKPPMNFQNLVNQWKAHKLTVSEIAKICGMSESTFYRRLRELRAKAGK